MRKDSAKPTLIVTDNYRLFVADAYGVAEVHMPALAKSFYLMLLRHLEGVVFDDSHKARKELVDSYYDITHSPLDDEQLRQVVELTEPPMGNIAAIFELIGQTFIASVGENRAQPFLVDYSSPNAVRVALPSENVMW